MAELSCSAINLPVSTNFLFCTALNFSERIAQSSRLSGDDFLPLKTLISTRMSLSASESYNTLGNCSLSNLATLPVSNTTWYDLMNISPDSAYSFEVVSAGWPENQAATIMGSLSRNNCSFARPLNATSISNGGSKLNRPSPLNNWHQPALQYRHYHPQHLQYAVDQKYRK